jgi:uncharacterized membrane protein YhaH (DUF805 family)
MGVRTKKFFGVLIFVIFTTIYFLMAVTVAIARLPDTSTATQLAFYIGATVLWFLCAMLIIRWASPKGPIDMSNYPRDPV